MSIGTLLFAQTDQVTTPTTTPASQPAQVDVGDQIASFLGSTWDNNGLGNWLTLMLGIFGGLIAGKVVQAFLRKISNRLVSRGWVVRGALFQYRAGPASLALFALGLGIGLQGMNLTDSLNQFSIKIVGFLYIVALAWFLFNMVELVDIGLRALTSRTHARFDDTLAMLLRKALRIFLLVMFGLFIAENTFGADITAWLAGLGIAGLAVSLAAQDSVKNVFGSVTVLMDRPFGLNDAIRFGDLTGTVEKIGFRSTKLRTLDGILVTVPNMKLIDGVVQNFSARKALRRQMNVTLACDTPPEKIEQAVKIIQDLLAEPLMSETFNQADPPRVFFNDFNADSFNIQVTYWYQLVDGRDFWTHQAQTQEFNMRLVRALNDAGIEMAYPTRTLYLAGDPNRQLSINVHNGNGQHQDERKPSRLEHSLKP